MHTYECVCVCVCVCSRVCVLFQISLMCITFVHILGVNTRLHFYAHVIMFGMGVHMYSYIRVR